MKIRPAILPFIVLILLLTACSGDTGGEVEPPGEGFDFSDEEGLVLNSEEEGFTFLDDEAFQPDSSEGFDFSEEEAAGDEGNSPDEPRELSAIPNQAAIYPPEGTTGWLFNHDDVVANCASVGTMVISGPETENVTISLGAEGASLVMSDLYAGAEVFYILLNAGVGASNYIGQFIVPESGIVIDYDVLFTSLEDNPFADFVIGSLISEHEGCVLTRDFSGYLVD